MPLEFLFAVCALLVFWFLVLWILLYNYSFADWSIWLPIHTSWIFIFWLAVWANSLIREKSSEGSRSQYFDKQQQLYIKPHIMCLNLLTDCINLLHKTVLGIRFDVQVFKCQIRKLHRWLSMLLQQYCLWWDFFVWFTSSGKWLDFLNVLKVIWNHWLLCASSLGMWTISSCSCSVAC